MIQHNSNNLNRKIGKAKWTAEKMLNMLRVLQIYLLNEKKSIKKYITATQSQIWTHMETHMHRDTHTHTHTHKIQFSQPV